MTQQSQSCPLCKPTIEHLSNLNRYLIDICSIKRFHPAWLSGSGENIRQLSAHDNHLDYI
jgi:hypothetical protein